jgi:hypothetical protein
MVLKTHKFLQPLASFEYVAERTSDEDFNLDILEMTLETNGPSKRLVR